MGPGGPKGPGTGLLPFSLSLFLPPSLPPSFVPTNCLCPDSCRSCLSLNLGVCVCTGGRQARGPNQQGRGAAGPKGFKGYNQGQPGMPMNPMMQQMPPQMPPQQMDMGMGGGLTAAALAAAPQPQQKQMLGERLYPLIQAQQPELAGKITGMLLEMDNSELLLLLDSQESLSEKISEALKVLEEHEAQQRK